MVQTSSKPDKLLSLELPYELGLKVSPSQFERLAATNRDLRLERTCTGELIVNPPTGWETGERNFSLIGQFAHWYEERGGSGKAFDSSTGFTLPNGAIRSPDLSWVSQARWDALGEEQKQTFPIACPDFVVELRSDSDTLKSLRDKMQEYMDNGARLGWLLDPKNKSVEVYRMQQGPERLAAPNEISGEDVLPGFILNLCQIWS